MTAHSWAAARVLALAGLLSAATLVSACSSPASSANPAATITVTQTPVNPASPPPGTPAAATSTTAPAGPPACPTRDLMIKPGPAQGTAGSDYQVIDFTNISQSTCSLYGYQIGRASCRERV